MRGVSPGWRLGGVELGEDAAKRSLFQPRRGQTVSHKTAPVLKLEAFNPCEMGVERGKMPCVFNGLRGDPDIVFGNWRAGF